MRERKTLHHEHGMRDDLRRPPCDEMSISTDIVVFKQNEMVR